MIRQVAKRQFRQRINVCNSVDRREVLWSSFHQLYGMERENLTFSSECEASVPIICHS